MDRKKVKKQLPKQNLTQSTLRGYFGSKKVPAFRCYSTASSSSSSDSLQDPPRRGLDPCNSLPNDQNKVNSHTKADDDNDKMNEDVNDGKVEYAFNNSKRDIGNLRKESGNPKPKKKQNDFSGQPLFTKNDISNELVEEYRELCQVYTECLSVLNTINFEELSSEESTMFEKAAGYLNETAKRIRSFWNINEIALTHFGCSLPEELKN